MMVTNSIAVKNKMAASRMFFFSLNKTSGAKIKASRYQLFANKNLKEISTSEENITVTQIQAKCKSNKPIKGCRQTGGDKMEGL